MITFSIDDQPNVADEVVKLMGEIDPRGTHKAFTVIDDALDFAEENKPDVAWLDIEMPEKSGLELAMDIKKFSPKTNIIFVTGHEKFTYQAFKLRASGYVLKPFTREDLERELENLRNPVETQRKGLVRVQCFGNFEVFDKEDHPVKFKRKKSKELLAYLVDRRGALCSIGELCGILFEDRDEDRDGDRALKKQLRVFLSSLKDDLEQAGTADIFVKGWNAYGVDCSKIDCDYLNYLKGDSYAINSFMGEYMIQYSWAEMTLGELINK